MRMLQILMIGFLILLLGCSNRVIIKEVDKPILPPDSLLLSPCDPIDAGETVRSLGKGYVENTSCVYQHKTTLQSLQEWKKQKEELYVTPNK